MVQEFFLGGVGFLTDCDENSIGLERSFVMIDLDICVNVWL